MGRLDTPRNVKKDADCILRSRRAGLAPQSERTGWGDTAGGDESRVPAAETLSLVASGPGGKGRTHSASCGALPQSQGRGEPRTGAEAVTGVAGGGGGGADVGAEEGGREKGEENSGSGSEGKEPSEVEGSSSGDETMEGQNTNKGEEASRRTVAGESRGGGGKQVKEQKAQRGSNSRHRLRRTVSARSRRVEAEEDSTGQDQVAAEEIEPLSEEVDRQEVEKAKEGKRRRVCSSSVGKRERTMANLHAASSGARGANSKTLPETRNQKKRTDGVEENSEDDEDLDTDEERAVLGTITSDPPDDSDDSDWLLENNDEEVRSESSISESEMEEYFLRDSEDGADKDGAGAGWFGGRQRRRKKKRKRAEPFSGKRAERKKRRRKTAATPSEMPPEVKKLMGEATDAYLNEEFDEAVKILQEVVRRCPGLHDPFHLLGLIYEEAYGDKRRAVDFYLLAAHLVVPGDPELWRHTGNMSLQLSNIPQAIYCFRRCLRNGSKSGLATAASASAAAVVGARAESGHPGPLEWEGEEEEEADGDQEEDEARGLRRGKEDGEDESGWEEEEGRQRRKEDRKEKPTSMEEEVAFALASCYQQTGEHRRAASLLYALLSFHPRDFLFTRELARSLHRIGRVTEARNVLETAVLPLLPPCVRTEVERAGPSEAGPAPAVVVDDRPSRSGGPTEDDCEHVAPTSACTTGSRPEVRTLGSPSGPASSTGAVRGPFAAGTLQPTTAGTEEAGKGGKGGGRLSRDGEEPSQGQSQEDCGDMARDQRSRQTEVDEVVRKLEAEPEWAGRMVLEPLQLDCINILAELYLHQEFYRRCFLLLRFVTRGWFPVQLPLDLFVKREAAALFVASRSHAADVADRLLRNAAISEAPADARPTDSAATLMGSAETARSPAADRQSDAADSMEVNRGDGEEVKATHARDQALPALPEDSKAPEAKAVATVENSTGSGGSKAAGDANDGRKKKEVKGEYGDLFLVLADAWAFAGDDSRARELYYILQELPEFSRDTNLALKTAHCLLRRGDASAAAEFLQGWLAKSEAAWQHTAGVRDADVRLLLCDVLKRLGRDLEADYTLLTISYKHLREKDKLPRAWTNADRERQLFDLQGLLESLVHRSPQVPPLLTSADKTHGCRGASLSSVPGATEQDAVGTPLSFPGLHPRGEDAGLRSEELLSLEHAAGEDDDGERSGWRAHRSHTASLQVEGGGSSSVRDVVGVSPAAVADRFLALVRECELDSRRVLRQVCQRRVEIAQDPRVEHFFSKATSAAPATSEDPGSRESSSSLLNLAKKGGSQDNRVKDPNKALQHYKIKQDLGLKSIEDFVGLRGYLDFLCKGVELLRRQGRYEVAVSLLEAVLVNWRQKRSDGNDAQKRFIKDELEMISLSLSVEGQLVRGALASLRRILQRRMSSRRPGNTTGLLGLYGRLLFAGPLSLQAHQALAAAKEKDLLLENRSWAIRQLLHQPHNDALTLIVGHFCMLSSRWRFAVAEYTRAHCLRPDDPLACLCLAVAYLCLSTSNKVQNKHDIVLRGFALLGKYSQLRQQNAAQLHGHRSPRDSLRPRVLSAESLYNLARAYHHVNLLHLAVPLYIKCLEILDEIEDDLRMSKRCTQVGCWKPEAFCHSKLPVRNEFCSCLEAPGDNGVLPESHHAGWSDGAGSAGKTISGADAGMKFDREQIKRCAAHNLICIWRVQGAREQACHVAHKYLVWDE